MNKRTLILSAVGLLLLVILGVAGYFLVIKMDEVHKENVDNLAAFGSVVTPGNKNATTQGVLGQDQLPPSIGEQKISTSDKIIISLSEEKAKLVQELTAKEKQIANLQAEVEKLRRYRETNERFAPRMLDEERNRAMDKMVKYLEESEDAARFNRFQKEAMALDSANTYLDTLRQYQLVFSESQKEQLIAHHLSAYAFCVGDSIGIVANNRSEETQVLEYFRTQDPEPLSPLLREDIKAIRMPCLHSLNERVNQLLQE